MKYELTYHREGDYLIPDLSLPKSPKIGVWGRRRLRYLKGHKDPIYTGMLLRGTLNTHLEEINRQAEEMLELLVKQIASKEGITEQLKAEDQMGWVAKMNNIQSQAIEIINNELIYA